jgi:hypothetical protein
VQNASVKCASYENGWRYCIAAAAATVLAFSLLASGSAAQSKPAAQPDSDTCLACHGDQSLATTRDGKSVSLFVDAKKFSSSVHGILGCPTCHKDIKGYPHPEHVAKVNCTACHDKISQEYGTSIHGKLLAQHDPNAPACSDCHSKHEILPKSDPHSTTFPIAVPATCAQCHRAGQKATVRYTGRERNPVGEFTESIHGKDLHNGLLVAPTCTTCHTAHRILPYSDPKSSVNPQNVAATCTVCHSGIQNQLEASVHSPLVTKTDKHLPACDDCHSAHSIRRVDDAGFKLAIMETCGHCHEHLAETYFDTYHGKVSKLGYTQTAKCYDCHGAHDILRVSDPHSRLSSANVVQTCQQCHPGATRRFAGYLTHATPHDPRKYPYLFITFWAMTALLISVFLVSGIHVVLWFPRSLQMRRELHKAEAIESGSESRTSPKTKKDSDA